EPQVERELAALDAALAGLDVPDDLVDRAALSTALRDERPSIDAEFAALLDDRAAAGFPRGAGPAPRSAGLVDRLRATPPRRLLAPAGAVATLLVVVGVAITAVGGFGGGGSSSSSSSRVESTIRGAPGSTPTLTSPARAQFQLNAPSGGSA